MSISGSSVRHYGERWGAPPENDKEKNSMPRYLLSTHSVEGSARPPMSDEEMQAFAKRIGELESEMKDAEALVLSARLAEPAAARVARISDEKTLITDGPFAESKEQLGGFYLIEAENLEGALGWAEKVTKLIKQPIEVRELVDYR
jgi:hypothetical protein